MKKEKYFKSRYMIAFYTSEENGDELVGLFDNIKEVALFMNIDPESSQFNTLKARISNAVKKKCKLNTRYMWIDHKLARPYLIPIDKETDNEILL